MTSELGNATLDLNVDLKNFNEGIDQAQENTEQLGDTGERTGKRLSGAFGRIGKRIQGAARNIPIIGEELASLPPQAALVAVGIGAITAGLIASVRSVTELERELRPMIQRSGLAAESLQVLTKAANRLGSEDGLDGVTDGAQELQLRLGEAVQDGTGPAVVAFEKLGLASQELIDASPEESFLSVITALQGVTNESDRKFLADELLGGASERLSGIINTNSEDFQALTQDIRENSNIVSNEGVASARALSINMERLGQTFGRVTSTVGVALIPIINGLLEGLEDVVSVVRATFMPIWEELQVIWAEELQPALEQIITVMRNDLLPALQDIYGAIAPVLLPILRVLFSILRGLFSLLIDAGVTAFNNIASVIQIVAAVLTGDFTAAWQGIRRIVFNSLRFILDTYNNTIAKLPGFAEIHLGALEESFDSAQESGENLAASMDMVAEGTDTVSNSRSGLSATSEELAAQEALLNEELEASAETLDDLENANAEFRQELLEINRSYSESTLDAELELNRDLIDAASEYADDRQTLEDDHVSNLMQIEAEYRIQLIDAEMETAARLLALDVDYGLDRQESSRQIQTALADITRTHQQSLEDAERDHQQRLLDISGRASDSREDAQTGLTRKLEDIERNYLRSVADLENSDADVSAERRAAIRARRDSQIEDATIGHQRRLEDIRTREQRQEEAQLQSLHESLAEINQAAQDDARETVLDYNAELAALEADRQAESLTIQQEGNDSIAEIESGYQSDTLEAEAEHLSDLDELQEEHLVEQAELILQSQRDIEDARIEYRRDVEDAEREFLEELNTILDEGLRAGVANAQRHFDRLVASAIRTRRTLTSLRLATPSAAGAPAIIRNNPRLGAVPLQMGGIVTSPTLAVIGESGPEAVIPLSDIGNGLGGARTVTNNFSFEGNVLSEDIEDVITNALFEARRRNAFEDV